MIFIEIALDIILLSRVGVWESALTSETWLTMPSSLTWEEHQLIWFPYSGDGMVLMTREMLRWYGFVTREMLRWYGFHDSGDVEMIWFCHSADVEMVWFCHSGRVEMVWFWWLGRCKNGLVLILGRCWYSLVAALGRRNRWSSFGVPREMLVQFGFCTRETWNPPQTPYISRVRATSPESNHTPPEGENASGDVKNRFWL